jgi:hypothetical protein
VRPVSGTLEQVLSSLLPLTSGETQRELFIPTRSAWTAYVEHGWTGTDAASPMSYMARRLSIRCLRVVAVPPTLRKQQGGRYGAVMLSVYGPEQPGKISNTVRALAAANDGGRWVFEQSGEPFPFENLEQYQVRRMRDRFTFEMLKDYLRHLELAPMVASSLGDSPWKARDFDRSERDRPGLCAALNPCQFEALRRPTTCSLADSRPATAGARFHRCRGKGWTPERASSFWASCRPPPKRSAPR